MTCLVPPRSFLVLLGSLSQLPGSEFVLPREGFGGQSSLPACGRARLESRISASFLHSQQLHPFLAYPAPGDEELGAQPPLGIARRLLFTSRGQRFPCSLVLSHCDALPESSSASVGLARPHLRLDHSASSHLPPDVCRPSASWKPPRQTLHEGSVVPFSWGT